MAMEMKLQMRLSQQLIMTPQLQQAIKLLQLSRTELEELIDQAMVENPVLEEGIDIETYPEKGEEGINTEETQDMYQGPEAFESARETSKDEQTSDEIDWAQYVEYMASSVEPRKAASDDELPSLEATLAQGRSLADHLVWQLDMLKLDPLEHEVGMNLIGNIENDGYLTVSIRELLQGRSELLKLIDQRVRQNPPEIPEAWEDVLMDQFHAGSNKYVETEPSVPKPPVFAEDLEEAEVVEEALEVTPEAAMFVEHILRRIHEFDPAGVGARSLQECLLIQLATLGLKGDLSYRIIQQDMSLLEVKDLKKIARRHKESLENAIEAYKLIMSLEPKPGRAYSSPAAHDYIIPDVYIYNNAGNEFKVALNDSGVPRLRISDYYKHLADHMEEDGNLTKEYIQEKIKSGQWLMRSIEQRQKTIYRVTQSILKFQEEFFRKGINFLKPLVLKDVAEDISVHESTVSRITTNKYVHTPQGIFELKYFFTSGIDQGEGEAVSSKRIKDMIEHLINSEDPKDPFTDLQIAEILLEKSGIRVARRTVAKYREALNILPSNKRKQLF